MDGAWSPWIRPDGKIGGACGGKGKELEDSWQKGGKDGKGKKGEEWGDSWQKGGKDGKGKKGDEWGDSWQKGGDWGDSWQKGGDSWQKGGDSWQKGGDSWQKGGDGWQKGGDWGDSWHKGKGDYSDYGKSSGKGGYSKGWEDSQRSHGGSSRSTPAFRDDEEPSISEVIEAMKLIKAMKREGLKASDFRDEPPSGSGVRVPIVTPSYDYSKGKGKYDKGKGKDDKGKGKYDKGKPHFHEVDGVTLDDSGNMRSRWTGKVIADSMSWKARLLQAYGTKYTEPPRKDISVVFTTAKEGDGWVCSVACDKFDTVYGCEGTAATEKQAEENAAMVMMRTEFPAFYNSAPDNAKRAGEDLTGQSRVPKPDKPTYVPYVQNEPEKGKKGKGKWSKEGKPKRPYTDENGNSSGEDPKSQLNHSIRVVCNRPIVKGEIFYVVEEVEEEVEEEVNGEQVKKLVKCSRATVTVNCVDDTPRSYTGGEIAGISDSNKRQAEHSAAAVALEAFKGEIEAAMPVFLATKEVRKAEKAEREAARTAANAERLARGEPIDPGPPERKKARYERRTPTDEGP